MGTMTPLLLVDDDTKLCRLIKTYLEPLGYSVTISHTGRDGLRLALDGVWDAVILDVMLPEVDGFEILRQLRMKSPVPVLMLTGLGEESDRIVGLELGADDYLPKTFSTRELLARLRSVIRRSKLTIAAHAHGPQPLIEVQDLVVNPDARSASLAGAPMTLTPVEFDLLLSLARNTGRVRTREQLLLEVADRDFDGLDRSIDVHISSLRKKLGDDSKNPRYIQTIRSAGYMLLKDQST
jgi:DNA-binding response OmpR family regulator